MAGRIHNDPKKNLITALNIIKMQIIESQREMRQSKQKTSSRSRKKELIRKIERLFLVIGKCAADGTIPSFLLKSRRTNWKDCNFEKRLSLKAKHELTCQTVKFTGNERRFVIICYLLRTIHQLLLTGSSVTKRELYYENTALFVNQNAVNTAVLDICDLLQASLWELRVMATSKGLVAGDLTLVTADKQVINCSKPGGVLVPQDVNGILKIKSSANFILVVEKDAAFQKLLDDGAHWRYGPCVIITGKGEPDINTRMFVCRLSRELAVPVLMLVDADPYGIEIMCTYRFGSLTMSQHSVELATPEMRWLGVHPTDVERFSIPTVPLTNLDFTKARDLIKRPYIQQNEQLLSQVNCLLESGVKCEIENLTTLSPNFLTDMFLSFKITSREVI